MVFFFVRVGLSRALVQALLLAVLTPLVACGAQKDVSLPQEPETLGPGNYDRTILVGDMERFYSLHVPPSYDEGLPTPVVLNFHGGGGNPETQRHASAMDETSDRAGFIVVYPQGTGRAWRLRSGFTWNAGTCCGWAQQNNIDDVGFTLALLDDLSKILSVDSKRVYATGISNGAMMCYRLACELSDRIAAIAPVAGPMQMPECNPARAVPVMHFHGTEDVFAPMRGGEGQLPGQFLKSVDETLNFWLKRAGLEGVKPEILRRGNAVGEYYGPGRDGHEVALWRVEGGGHTWPGGRFGLLKERALGQMTMDISASDLMWEFFKRHALP